MDTTRDRLEDDFCGLFDSFRDYADGVADETIASHRLEGSILASYFDYDAFARDLRMDMHVIELRSGRVAVFHA